MMRFNQSPPQRPMNPAAPRQFGAFGGQRPQLSARPLQGGMGGAPPRPMAPRAPQQGNPWALASGPPRPQSPRAPQRNPMMGAAGGMGASMMSDERSKKRIQELEDLNDQYASLLDTPAATANVKPKAPPTADLDRSNARALGEAGSYSYEYKNPNAPGAKPGRRVGPMAQELEGIPGVVNTGGDGFKRVDIPSLSLATASATGDQERRLRTLEDDISALSDQGAFTDEEARMARELGVGEERALNRIRGASSQGAFTDSDMRALERIRGR